MHEENERTIDNPEPTTQRRTAKKKHNPSAQTRREKSGKERTSKIIEPARRPKQPVSSRNIFACVPNSSTVNPVSCPATPSARRRFLSRKMALMTSGMVSSRKRSYPGIEYDEGGRVTSIEVGEGKSLGCEDGC